MMIDLILLLRVPTGTARAWPVKQAGRSAGMVVVLVFAVVVLALALSTVMLDVVMLVPFAAVVVVVDRVVEFVDLGLC